MSFAQVYENWLLRGSLAVALTALLWQLRPHWLEPLLT